MTARSFLFLAAAVVCGLLGEAAADENTSTPRAVSPGEWPQWRGAGRDGAVSTSGGSTSAATDVWPERLTPVWERDVGAGYSGPVVAGRRVWIHTRQGEQEVVTSLTLADGKPLWSRRYDASFEQDAAARSHGRGPYSTPALADGRLFTYSVTGVLSVWDAATGELLWRRSSADEFDPSFPYFGAAASPLVWDDLCFMHLGGHERVRSMRDIPWRGAMVALRVADGTEVWRWDGDGPAQGASPLMAEFDGRRQLVVESLQNVVGLDPRNGEELWRIPYKVPMDNTLVSPLFVDDRLVLSGWEMGVSAWRIRSEGESWVVKGVWKNPQVSLFMSSPVAAAGQIVGFSHYRMGQLFGLDPEDGKVLWRGDGRSGEHASLLSWNDKVLAFLEDGTLVVGELFRDGLRPVRRYRLGAKGTWTHPAAVEGWLLVKDGRRLVVYQLDQR